MLSVMGYEAFGKQFAERSGDKYACVLICFYYLQESITGDFPGGPVVENLPSSAGDEDSVSGQGTKTKHTREALAEPMGTVFSMIQHPTDEEL